MVLISEINSNNSLTKDIDVDLKSNYISLNKTLLFFDLESENKACQELEISCMLLKRIAWRIRTNAPICYIVNPNSGILDENCLTTKVKIELVNKNYHPTHKILVQAAEISSHSIKNFWENKCKKNNEIQTINLKLTTSNVNFNSVKNEIKIQQALLNKSLNNNTLNNVCQIRELENLLLIIHLDCQSLSSNLLKINWLKKNLQMQLIKKQAHLSKLEQNLKKQNNDVLKYRKNYLNVPSSCILS